MRAFLTGSRVYGSPRVTSDVDLVVLVSPETLDQLALLSDGPPGDYDSPSVSLRFGRLNLICVSEPEDAADWAVGTDMLSAGAPVFRPVAVDLFKNLFTIRNNQRERERSEREAMPVNISLLHMVSLPGTRDLWPDDFRALVEPLEEDPSDRNRWGVLADWLSEQDEIQMADTCRWIFRHPEVVIKEVNGHWHGYHLPVAVDAHWSYIKSDNSTLPGLVSALCYALEAARKEVE